MSFARPFLNLFLRAFEKPFLAKAPGPDEVREGFERKARVLFAPRGRVSVTECALGGVPALEVELAKGPSDQAAVLYLHGGGYVFGSARTHSGLGAALALRTGLPVYLPDYRLAPEHPYPAALEDARAAYDALRAEGREVFLGGDSAGGGLVLALLGQLAREGVLGPKLTFAFSPLTDFSFTNPSLGQNADADVLLPVARAEETGEIYLAGQDPRDPGASPYFGTYPGAGEVMLFVSRTEILLNDTLKMAARLRALGVMVSCEIAADLPHAWPYFERFLPEARASLARIAARITPAP